ncbi:MAG: pseudouridine synthase [Verrucomicrobiota bacterium]
MLIAFHKPYGVLSQFNRNPDEPEQRTLAEFDLPEEVFPIGRLDMDSEGLLLLTDENEIVHRLLHPKFRHRRRYLLQVEGAPEEADLEKLRRGGVEIKGYKTLPCRAKVHKGEPDFPPRDPPIRERADIPATWLTMELREGKNRQVRRMTAAIGYPTLRLVRVGVGRFPLGDLKQGHWKELGSDEREFLFQC